MSKGWKVYSEKWEGLVQRERLLILITVIAGITALLYVSLIEPALLKVQSMPGKIETVESQLKSQTQVLELLQSQKAVDPNVKAREELRRLRAELETADREIQSASDHLVAPDKMLTLLRSVLSPTSGVTLLRAGSLPVETISLGAESEESDQPQALIYLHPFEIELEASYQALYDYLQVVEALDGVFFWDLLEYQVSEYPTAKIKIRVHTLSTERGWLGA